MFTLDDFRTLLAARPFVPFRLHLSDGGPIDVRTPEVVLVGRQYAVVGRLDPAATDTLIDSWTTVFYMQVTRAEQLSPSQPPFAPAPSQV